MNDNIDEAKFPTFDPSKACGDLASDANAAIEARDAEVESLRDDLRLANVDFDAHRAAFAIELDKLKAERDGYLAQLQNDEVAQENVRLKARIAEMEGKLEDFKAGRFTYCAYCGHEENIDVDGSVIAEHIRTCPKHPLAQRIRELEADRDLIAAGAFKAAAAVKYLHPYARNEDGQPYVVGLCKMDQQHILALTPADALRAVELDRAKVRLAESEWWTQYTEHSQDCACNGHELCIGHERIIEQRALVESLSREKETRHG